MVKKYFVLLLTVFALFFSSCVSKKKFLEMQQSRLTAEQQVRQLTEENNEQAARIKTMISDFETIKSELMESNAIKDQYINELNKDIVALKTNLGEQKKSLENKSYSFSFEQERLSESLKARDNTIRSLEAQVKELEADISEQASVLSDRNIRISVLNDRISSLETELDRNEKRQEELMAQLQKARAETKNLQAQLTEKDETIKMLQNNVNLLKNELGGGNN